MNKHKLQVFLCKLEYYNKKLSIEFDRVISYDKFYAIKLNAGNDIDKITSNNLYEVQAMIELKRENMWHCEPWEINSFRDMFDDENRDKREPETPQPTYTKENYFKQFCNGEEFEKMHVHGYSIHSIFKNKDIRYIVLISDENDIENRNKEDRHVIKLYNNKNGKLIIKVIVDNKIPPTAIMIPDIRKNGRRCSNEKYTPILSLLFNKDREVLQKVYKKAGIRKAFIESLYEDDDGIYVELSTYTKKISGIKIMRECNGYRQEEIAALLGIPQGTYSKYERGSIEVPAYIIYRLSCIYNVSMEHLMNKDEYILIKDVEVHINAYIKYLKKCVEDVRNNKKEYIINQVKKEAVIKKENQDKKSTCVKYNKDIVYSYERKNYRKIDKRIQNALIDLLNGLIKKFNKINGDEVIFVRGCGNDSDNNKNNSNTDS